MSIQRLLAWADNFQQNHKFAGFPFAVVKKYGEDEAGYQAALITYYGFLSLFPLLLVAYTLLNLILKNDPSLHARLLKDISSYFPVVGNNLQQAIHTRHNNGIFLAVGILGTLYGARGGADAIRHALNHIWQVPRLERPGFPKNVIKSLSLVFVGGGGLLLAAVLAGYAATLGSLFIYRIFSVLVSILVLFGAMYGVYHISIESRAVTRRSLVISALVTAIALEILQVVGGYILKHQLSSLKGTYGSFAIVLGLLFWIYLQAQVMMYAAAIGVVKRFKLWPRSLRGGPHLTEADKKAYTLLAKQERRQPPEEIDVRFGAGKPKH